MEEKLREKDKDEYDITIRCSGVQLKPHVRSSIKGLRIIKSN